MIVGRIRELPLFGPQRKRSTIILGSRRIDVRLRFIALVLLVIAGTAAGFVLTRVDSSRDAWLVLGTGLALAAVTGVLVHDFDPTRFLARSRHDSETKHFGVSPTLATEDGAWMPTRGPRRSVCAKSVIMNRA
jgi:hypothetical protein